MKNLKLQLKIKNLFPKLYAMRYTLCAFLAIPYSLFAISPVLAQPPECVNQGFHCCTVDQTCNNPKPFSCDSGSCCETCEAAEEGAVDLGPIGGEEGFGPWGNIANLGTEVGEAAKSFTKIISNIIGVMTIAGGIWFMFQFIAGGLGWLTAGGDKAGVQAAQKRITNAVIGLVVVVSAYALIWIIGELLGFDILHPEDLINLVGPK